MKLFEYVKDFVFRYVVVRRLKPKINKDRKFSYVDPRTDEEYTDLDSIYDIIAIKSGYGRDVNRECYKIWLEMLYWNIIHEFKIESNSIVLESRSRYNNRSGYEYVAKEVEKIMIDMYKDAKRKISIRKKGEINEPSK